MSPVQRQGDRRIETRREADRLMHYAVQNVLAAVGAWFDDADPDHYLDADTHLSSAWLMYRAAEAALLAEAT